MRIRVGFTIFVLGLISAQGGVSWGQDQTTEQHSIMKRYHSDLNQIPKNLPPEQRYITEQRLKQQMMYERLKKQAASPQATSSTTESTKKP